MKKINLIGWLSRNSHEKQKMRGMRRYAAMLIMLLTLGVGQMWGGNAGYVGNNESYFKNYVEYSKNGGSATQFKVDGSGQSDLALGVVSSLTLTQYGVGMYQDEDNLNGKESDKFCYWIHQKDDSSEDWTEVTGNWQDFDTYGWSGYGSWRHPGFGHNNLGINVLDGLGAGEYKLTFYFKHQGNSNWGNAWLYLSNGGSNYNITFTIAPVVTFKANGGTGSDYTQTVTYDTNTALTANTFTKTGYDFAGWATSAGGSVAYANGADVKLTDHTTLFAKWTAHNYTASNNIKHADGSTAGQYNVNYDATSISYTTTPSKTGYNLEGLYYESGLSNKIVNNDRSLRASTSYTTSESKWNQTSAPNLYAKWTAKTYSITLDDDGAYDGNGSATVTYNGTALSISSHASRDGWNLVGYFAAGTGDQVTDASGNLLPSKSFSDGSSHAITNSSSQWIYDGNLTLYAHWSKEYSVTYNANGGTGTTTDASSPYEAGSNVTVLSNSFTRSGYSFTGWNTSAEGDGTPYAAGATISSIAANVTLYAQWSENDYTVTVNAGSNGSVASGSVTGHYDTKVDLPDATANTGYHFDTWTTTSGSVTYTNQTSATTAQVNGLTAAATVRADFAANTYSVVFNANGGSGTMSNESFTYGVSKALTSNSYTKSGYTFIGWATSAERANALTVDYTNGQSVSNLTSTNGGTYNLYAVWAKKYYIGGRFQHDWEDGSTTTNEMTYVSAGRYKFVTSKTVSQLSEQWHNVSGDYYADQLFFIHTGSGKNGSSSNPFYTTPNEDGAGLNFETSNSYANALVLKNQETTWGTIVANRCVQFSNVDNLSSNVIIWWEPSTKKIWYEATESLNTNYYLLGFGSDHWGETDARRFKVASVNATTATVTVSLTAKTYTGGNNEDGFKLKNGSNYYGNTGTMTRANCSNWSFTEGSNNNCGITADLAGTYTFTLNLSTKAISVTYPTAYQLNYSIGSIAGTDGSIYTSPSTSSGSYVGSGNSVTLTGPAAKTGYTWKGWYTNAAGTEGKIADESRAITVTMNADKTLYACYTENSYSTNVAVSPAAKGSITDPTPAAGKIDVSHHTGTSVTATAITNYVFDHWGVSGGGLTVNSTTANPATFKATSANGTITAYFEDQWCIKGDQWDSWSTSKGLPNTGTNTYSASFTLTKGQKYKFKVHDRKTNTWYGNTKDAGEHAMERGDAAYGTANNGGNDDNLTITPDVTGDYTFSFNTSTKEITVTYPTAYTVTFGAGTINGSDAAITASASPSFSSGDYVLPETDITFSKGDTKDGYTWKGWYSNAGGTGEAWSTTDASLSLTDTRAANISVYACYNFITYNITYNLNGGSNPVSPAPATSFNVETLTITLPTPTRTGYTFDGWYANSDLSTGGVKTQIAKGTHEDQEFWAKWTAKTYTITLKPNGGSGDDQSVTATFDATAPDFDEVDNYRFDDIENPTRTGYTFGGWNTENDGSGTQIITEYKYYEWNTSYVNNSGLWKHDGNVTTFAKWTANNYTVTLSCSGETGYGSSPSGVKGSVSATYDSSMPAMGTAPVGAPGYKFEGYWSGTGGTGTQYYAADGSSVTNWNVASATTLHAYFKKTEISTLEHPASIAKGDVVTLDVNPVYNQSGAQDYMAICWSLLYDNDNPVESGVAIAANPVEGKPNQVRYTLTGLSAGYYKVKAVLKANASSSFNPCSAGTELSTIKSDLRIAGNSTVTIQYEDANGNALRENATVEVARGDSIGVKAPNIIGYSFTGWTLGDVISNTCRDGGSCGTGKDSINIKAEYDGYLIATYTKKQMVYFNNTLGWSDVYVYFYNDGGGNRYWADNYGTGANQYAEFGENKPYWEMEHGHMTQIEGTNIWYFDFKAAGYNTTRTKVAFADKDQSRSDATRTNEKDYFQSANVVYRTDFDATNLPMFVPINSVEYDYTTNTGSKYYRGYWMNYPESTGYMLKIYDHTGNDASLVKERNFEFSANKALPMSIAVDLEGGNKTYGFKIYRADNTWFRNGGTMTNGHSGDEGQAAWVFGSESGTNCGLTTTSAGDYTFTLSFNSSGSYQVGVHYPESTNDFRVMYTDDVRIANHDSNEGKSWLLSAVIPSDTESDTISYFVRAEGSKHPKIKIQKCTVTEEEAEEERTVGWEDQGSATAVPDSITTNGVYNFIFTKSEGNLVLSKIEPYEGNFYIRVDGAGSSNWDNFRAADHLMPYSDYSFSQTTDPYSHYYMKYYETKPKGGGDTPKNIKFVVANDYSTSISDTIVRDGIADAYVDANGWLSGRNANIRFMYNYKTNVATRRYLDDAQGDNSTDFLNLLAQTKDGIYLVPEDGDAQMNIQFADKGDWIYEKTVYAVPGARYKLRAQFGKAPGTVITQYFKGGVGETAADSATLIGGSGSRLPIRLIYDFKTNRIVTAYQPLSGTIDGNLEINADIMFMREHQGDIQQITFAPDKSISKIENIYCGLRFNKWTLNNKSKAEGHATLSPLLSRYERDIFYVSFPYDVRLSDVIGFGTYGQHWIVEYYDGAARAKNGFWMDSESYWKFVTPSMKDTFTLKAGTGYIVALDLDELYYIDGSHHADIWNNTETNDVELLFPGDVNSISDQAVTFKMPEHTCTINRGTTAGNRTIKDSHWNVLGVPTFKNITGQASGEPDEGVGSGEIVFANKAWVKDSLKLKFIYDGNLADNSLTPKAVKDFEFKAMHAYVVQYCGDVTFTTSATPAPASVAARTYAEEPIDVDFRLELNKDGVVEDQTFVSMTNNEDASAGFAFGEDLSKEFNNNRANIYTFIGTEWVAGNTLPMTNQTTIVPVGVKIAADGEYTFSIPEGTYGVGITLIDNETGARVNLGLMDYTVTLAAGQIDDRFVLEISPVHQSPTGVELLNGENGENGVRKVLIDNILYIVKDGVVYDAQGKRVQ